MCEILPALAKGKTWAKNRQIVHRALVTSAVINYLPGMVDTVQRSICSLLSQITNGERRMPVQEIFKHLAFDIFGVTTLGYDFKSSLDLESPHTILTDFKFLQEEFSRRSFEQPLNLFAQIYWLPTPANLKHRQAQAELRTFLKILIQEHRKKCLESTRNNFLETILQAASHSKDGKSIDDDVIADFLITILYGGFDTTSITLSYAFYIVANRPDLESNCLEEIQCVLASNNWMQSLNEESLPYCTGFLLETLRLYPSVCSVARDLTKNRVIGPRNYPQGTRAFVCPWMIHRDERNFYQPLDFLPERWAAYRNAEKTNTPGQSPWTIRTKSLDTIYPNQIPPANRDYLFTFSAGARRCVGQKYAMQELLTVFALFLREIKVRPASGYDEPKQIRVGIVQYPSEGLPLLISKRQGLSPLVMPSLSSLDERSSNKPL